jgi:hypothetical protein
MPFVCSLRCYAEQRYVRYVSEAVLSFLTGRKFCSGPEADSSGGFVVERPSAVWPGQQEMAMTDGGQEQREAGRHRRTRHVGLGPRRTQRRLCGDGGAAAQAAHQTGFIEIHLTQRNQLRLGVRSRQAAFSGACPLHFTQGTNAEANLNVCVGPKADESTALG